MPSTGSASCVARSYGGDENTPWKDSAILVDAMIIYRREIVTDGSHYLNNSSEGYFLGIWSLYYIQPISLTVDTMTYDYIVVESVWGALRIRDLT